MVDLSWLTAILSRYTSRIVGFNAVIFWGIVQFPELAWQLLVLDAVFTVGYIVSKYFGINGGPKQVVADRPPIMWEGPITSEHLREGGVT